MIGTVLQKCQIGLYTLCMALATVAIACRLWARRVTRTTWQLNDYFMILAYLNAIGLAISANLAVVNGEMGVHQTQIPKDRADEIYPFNMKMTMVIPFFLITSSFFVKMSITHFYIMLFPHTFLITLCQIQLPLLLACWIGTAIPCFLMCRPIHYLWDLNATGTCFDIQSFWLGASIIALYFDLLCVALPIPVVWRLRCSVGKKLKLTALFGLGFFICIITGLRIAKADTVNFDDLTWSAAPAVMCSVPEPVLSIVAGCLPVCIPLRKRASKPIRAFLRLPSRPPTPLPAPSADMVDLEATKRKPSLPLSDEEKMQRLQDHLYPMSSIVISTGNGSVGMSPMSPTGHTGLSPVPYGVRSPSIYDDGNEGFRGWVESPEHLNGIQVMTEVHIDSSRRQSLLR